MKRILSISLVLLILTGNLGLTIATHFCGGQAVMSEFTFGNEHLDCGMNDTEDSCESDRADQTVGREGCCENKYLNITGSIEDDYNPTAQFDIPNAKFVFALVGTFFRLHFPEADQKSPSLNFHPPPVLEQDFQVLYQTFLI